MDRVISLNIFNTVDLFKYIYAMSLFVSTFLHLSFESKYPTVSCNVAVCASATNKLVYCLAAETLLAGAASATTASFSIFSLYFVTKIPQRRKKTMSQSFTGFDICNFKLFVKIYQVNLFRD